MATSSSSLLCEDQFLCSICLGVFEDPVSTPCGHNFCKGCISGYWDTTDIYQCPLCKTAFGIRPDLRVNTFISELAAQFMTSVRVTDSSSPVQPRSRSGEVVCDVCTDPKLNAVKSCLECETSYCGTHLEPHQRVKGLLKHTLIDPVENLGDSMCQKHNRPLSLFCRAEQVTLCDICVGTHSRAHTVVPVQQECRKKRAHLGKMETKVQCMIHERLQKVQEFKHELEQSQEDGENEIAGIMQELSALMSAIEKSQAELIGAVDEKKKAAKKQAQDHVKDLEQEITELLSLDTQLKELLDTKDNRQLLQNFPSQFVLPNTKDWSVMASSEPGTEPLWESLRRRISHLKITVNQMRQEIKKSCDTLLSDAALRRMQQYAVDVVLDPSTAFLNLALSVDGKQVSYSTKIQRRLPSGRMFTNSFSVLGTMGFSSGKFYFEVYVGTKMEWCIGVATESINRKEVPRLPGNGLWALLFVLDKHEAFSVPDNPVYMGKVKKVGVFVDYEEGFVSIYDVDARCPIYSFTGCHFTEKIYPYLNPGDNEYGANLGPLVITAVSHTE